MLNFNISLDLTAVITAAGAGIFGHLHGRYFAGKSTNRSTLMRIPHIKLPHINLGEIRPLAQPIADEVLALGKPLLKVAIDAKLQALPDLSDDAKAKVIAAFNEVVDEWTVTL